MQRVFTEDVGNVPPDNVVRWPAGTIVDYPSDTWEGISHSVGRPLSEFTRTMEEVAQGAAAPPKLPLKRKGKGG